MPIVYNPRATDGFIGDLIDTAVDIYGDMAEIYREAKATGELDDPDVIATLEQCSAEMSHLNHLDRMYRG